MVELTLYTRSDCKLCDEMEAVVRNEMAGLAARLDKVLIDGKGELELLYGQEVPVLMINGVKAFKYRCGPRELRKRLAREGAGR